MISRHRAMQGQDWREIQVTKLEDFMNTVAVIAVIARMPDKLHERYA